MAVTPCLRCKRLQRDGSYCRACRPRPHDPGRLRGRAGQELRARVLASFAHSCDRDHHNDLPNKPFGATVSAFAHFRFPCP